MLIALEGIDGAGKQTQTRLLLDHLVAAGYRAATLAFPRYGETFFAQSIAAYLQGRFGALATVDPHLAALLYAGDRLESKPLLTRLAAEHDVVVLDRYVASNLAHQGARVPPAARPEFLTWLATIEYDIYGLPEADLTLYLDITTSAAQGLVHRRGAAGRGPARDLHEIDAAYLETCRQVYLMLLAQGYRSRWVAIPCCDPAGAVRPPEAVHAAVWEAVAPHLPPARG